MNSRTRGLYVGLFAAAAFFSWAALSSAATIAVWNFEAPQPTAVTGGMSFGPYAANTGSGSLTSAHTLASNWTIPAGNGSVTSLSSTNWSIGDYYQFSVSTTGQTGIKVSWNQTRSSTGAANFALQYSTDGGANYNTFFSYPVGTTAWNNMTSDPGSAFSQDLSSVTGLNNLATALFRLTATVANTNANGTNRIDNVVIESVPEPATCLLAGLSLMGFIVARRRAGC